MGDPCAVHNLCIYTPWPCLLHRASVQSNKLIIYLKHLDQSLAQDKHYLSVAIIITILLCCYYVLTTVLGVGDSSEQNIFIRAGGWVRDWPEHWPHSLLPLIFIHEFQA